MTAAIVEELSAAEVITGVVEAGGATLGVLVTTTVTVTGLGQSQAPLAPEYTGRDGDVVSPYPGLSPSVFVTVLELYKVSVEVNFVVAVSGTLEAIGEDTSGEAAGTALVVTSEFSPTDVVPGVSEEDDCGMLIVVSENGEDESTGVTVLVLVIVVL